MNAPAATTRAQSRQAGGFTLIELLVVIVILTLLAGILGPAVGRARLLVEQAAVRGDLRTIEGAIDAYARDFDGHAPPSSPSEFDPGAPGWVSGWTGAELVALYLTGYPDDDDNDGQPETNFPGDDGLDGWGFHVRGGKKQHGPYHGVQELPMGEDDNNRLVFRDRFDNVVLYYRFRGGGYHGGDNSDHDITPDDINDYARTGDGRYRRSDYLLITPGINREFEDEPGDNDDVTNME